MTFLALLLVAYVLGAIPFGVLVARAYGVDILKVGSGNIGATNVVRAVGKGPGILVWVLDVLKSLLPTLIAHVLIHTRLGPLDAQTQWFLVGCAAILGHCASPFLGFRGGKGISTALGAIVGTAPLVALLCFGLFAVVLATTRYMAIASTVGVSSVVLFAWLLGVTPQLLPVFVLLALFVAYRHRANFGRLREGTEPRFSFKGGGQRAEGGAPSSSARVGSPEDQKSSPGDEEGVGGGAERAATSGDPRDRLRLHGNDQLPDPQADGKDGPHAVQIADSILAQFLASRSGQALLIMEGSAVSPEEGRIKIEFDGESNGQLPLELAVCTLRRFILLANIDPLVKGRELHGRIRGTFDGAPFELEAGSYPVEQGVVFSLTKPMIVSQL